MTDINEQIAAIEEEIRKTPYHKGTQHHVGRMRAKIAHLKDKQIETASRKSGGGGGYCVKKQGDATIILIGPPSAGKSTLINKLTNAESKVAPYAFTTLTVIPGMMEYKKARLQILDVPGLIEGAGSGKGRGKEVMSVARNCDLIIFMTDPERLNFFKKLVKELELAGIRINKQKPKVKVDKKINGGILIKSNIKQNLDKETMIEVAEEFGIKNAEITVNETLTIDRLVDAFARNRVYIPALYIVNKIDEAEKSKLAKLQISKLDQRILRISAENETGLEELKNFIWEKLQFVILFLTKEDNKSENNPMIVKNGLTLKEVTEKIGNEFAQNIKSAKIWGNGAKFEGQEVSLKTKVQDGMYVRFN